MIKTILTITIAFTATLAYVGTELLNAALTAIG